MTTDMSPFTLFAIPWFAGLIALALTCGVAELRSRGYNARERRIRALHPLQNGRRRR